MNKRTNCRCQGPETRMCVRNALHRQVVRRSMDVDHMGDYSCFCNGIGRPGKEARLGTAAEEGHRNSGVQVTRKRVTGASARRIRDTQR